MDIALVEDGQFDDSQVSNEQENTTGDSGVQAAGGVRTQPTQESPGSETDKQGSVGIHVQESTGSASDATDETSGDTKSDYLKLEKWQRDLDDRVCILVYERSSEKAEKFTFHNDCLMMEEVMNYKWGFMTTTDELESRFLALTAFKEKKVTESMTEYLQTVLFKPWTEDIQVKELVSDMYLRVRLVKAAAKVIDCWAGVDERIEEANYDDYMQVLEVVLERWKKVNTERDFSQRGKILTNEKKILGLARKIAKKEKLKQYVEDLKNGNKEKTNPKELMNIEKKGSSSFADMEPHKFLKCYVKALANCTIFSKFSSNDAVFEVLKFADEIFSQSIYESGFPLDAFLETSPFRKFFDDSEKLIQRIQDTTVRTAQEMSIVKSRATHTYIEARNEETQHMEQHPSEVLLKVAAHLVEWRKSAIFPDQQIFIYYSGHGADSLQPREAFPNLYSAVALSCELFTDVIICMDCCYAHIQSNAPQRESLRFLLPNKGDAKAEMHKNSFSCFTVLLAFALRGFKPKKCFSTLQFAYAPIETCRCTKCYNYRQQLQEDNACNYCKDLVTDYSKNGFIFSRHIDQYFKTHICDKCITPYVTPSPPANIDKPLAKAV